MSPVTTRERESAKEKDVGDGGHDRETLKDKKSKSTSGKKDVSHVPCKFFKVGGCTAGSSCPFSHSFTEPGQQKDTCMWFVKGNCKFGHKCALLHILPGQPANMDRRNKKAAQQAAKTGMPETSGGGSQKDTTANRRSQKDSISNGLLTGATAPTRTSARTLPITKVTPSAPAPPLQDNELAFGLPDVPAPINRAGSQNPKKDALTVAPVERVVIEAPTPISPSMSRGSQPSMSPVAPQDPQRSLIPSATIPVQRGPSGSSDLGFGPIGSPPRGSAVPASRPNGFSPGTSPTHHDFSNNLSTSPFSAPGTRSLFLPPHPPTGGSALAMSVGASRNWDVPISSTIRRGFADKVVDDNDDELEEFLPSSLNELLSTSERERRFSRTAGGRPALDAHHHRYSRSVPGPSLLDGINSIWLDDKKVGNAGPVAPSPLLFGSPTNRADDGPSPSLLNPSNASGAFLNKMPRPSMQTTRTVSDHPPVVPNTADFNGRFPPFDGNGLTPLPRAIPGANPSLGSSELPNALSPSSRALQAHMPGQSLPLGAGFNRIHAQPPLKHTPSPSGLPQEWTSDATAYQNEGSDMIDTAPARPSYSAAARGNANLSSSNTLPMSSSYRRNWQPHPLSSPLSGPVITNDDDLFVMED